MTQLLTAEQMRAVEQGAIESGAATGLEMMDRAGHGVARAALARCAGPGHALVLAGPGNNGGDGLVVARLLRQSGWEVEVRLWGRAPDEIDRLPPDAAANAARWAALGEIRPWDDAAIAGAIGAHRHDLVIDALFGTGATRPMPETTARAGEALRAAAGAAGAPLVVAVDLPSGICSDSGRDLGGAFAADLTVTFHAAKLGHHLCDPATGAGGPEACGEIAVVEIGLGDAAPEGPACRLAGPPDPVRIGKRAGHKYAHGHALVLAGGVGRGGAARMAARGALRIGAGLVTVGCPPAALIENAARLDAIMLRPVADRAGLEALLADPRMSAVCLGPGLGLGARTRDLALAALEARPPRGVVLDADALTAFAEAPKVLFGRLHAGAVLTPHDGEFARLFPDIAGRLSEPVSRGPCYSRLDAARAAADRAGCTVLLKGPDTVIAAPDGAAAVSSAHGAQAVPWLATAGAGDVLAGMIAGLLARGEEAPEAAGTAAWLHVAAARKVGPGLVAEDLPEALPGVLRALGC